MIEGPEFYELPPIDEGEVLMEEVVQEEIVIKGPEMGINKTGDYVFGTDEIRKDLTTEVFVGDQQYVADEHGTHLLRETGPKDAKLSDKDYYDQGYQGQKKYDFGDEGAKKYDIGRKVDMMDRKLAEDYLHEKTVAPEIGPRKDLSKTKKKKKAKVIESLGSKKYPERLASKAGNAD